MKRLFKILPVILSLPAFTMTSWAGNATGYSATTIAEPLYTKSASVYSRLVLDGYIEYYTGRQFEEIQAQVRGGQ